MLIRFRDFAALISPAEFRLACDRLERVSHPKVYSKQFESGLVVLHTSQFTTQAFTNRILDLIDSFALEGASSLQLATAEQVSLGISNQFLKEIEQAGSIVRDEQDSDRTILWFRNYFSLAEWDGQPK
jgi:hypothetical protein